MEPISYLGNTVGIDSDKFVTLLQCQNLLLNTKALATANFLFNCSDTSLLKRQNTVLQRQLHMLEEQLLIFKKL